MSRDLLIIVAVFDIIVTMNMGDFIRRIRKEKGLSQEQVAEKAGLARSYISRLEDNQISAPSAMVLIKLAKGLNVSHDELFQVAGYVPHISKSNLPSLGGYLRTKYPELSENAIEEIEAFKNFIEHKYKSKK